MKGVFWCQQVSALSDRWSDASQCSQLEKRCLRIAARGPWPCLWCKPRPNLCVCSCGTVQEEAQWEVASAFSSDASGSDKDSDGEFSARGAKRQWWNTMGAGELERGGRSEGRTTFSSEEPGQHAQKGHLLFGL